MTSNQPRVSVLIPARNEEASLPRCLESLWAQSGIAFELIVVDDGSSDRTAEVASSFPGVNIIPAGSLPEGWAGKTNALAAGAAIARGEWLLFTDADTVHAPGSLARAVAEAERQGAALLSYSPQQDVDGFWEKAVMPVVFAELARTYPPRKVSDPSSPLAAANGQYLMISRQAYQAVGGHGKIAGDLLEDVALARLVKAAGGKIVFRYAADAVRTRMYTGLEQMKEGWTKNLARLFPDARRLAFRRASEFLLIFGGLLAAAAVSRWQPRLAAALLVIALGVFGAFWLRIRSAHFSLVPTLLSVFGLLPFALLLVHSRRAYNRKSVTWKGRQYGRELLGGKKAPRLS